MSPGLGPVSQLPARPLPVALGSRQELGNHVKGCVLPARPQLGSKRPPDGVTSPPGTPCPSPEGSQAPLLERAAGSSRPRHGLCRGFSLWGEEPAALIARAWTWWDRVGSAGANSRLRMSPGFQCWGAPEGGARVHRAVQRGGCGRRAGSGRHLGGVQGECQWLSKKTESPGQNARTYPCTHTHMHTPTCTHSHAHTHRGALT